ncbi:hypothetical protein BDN71DRAFT_1505943 [Pleurotus eryngii]|uniref:Ubiquitin-like domain-containing protein n=1 Tax=Pleurotus eryngii TaxID=5323 RepID=A0A9P5ZZD2_PLEER|nr:hypothetical protein BDN71DRAFT_1505943 [Pleurotus eryngii]
MQQSAPANPPFPITAKLDQRAPTLPCVPPRPPRPPSLYLTMNYPSNLSASPPTWLGLLASIGDDHATDNVAHPYSAATVVHYHNHNQGRGIFNHIHGNQQIHMNISLNCNPESSILCDTFPVIEPYQTAVKSLVDIIQVLLELPPSSTVTQREQLEGFLKMIVCAAKAMEIIRGNSPQLETMTFFSNVDRQARKFGTSLEQLRVDIGEFRDQILEQMETGTGATHDWPSLRTRLGTLIQDNQVPLEELLSILLSPRYQRILVDKYGELRDLVAHSGLIPKFDIRHPEVHTIWIQDPVGCNMYAIPLSLCTTWRDVRLMVGQYFREGPVSRYIRRGDWKMVRVDDNRVMKARSFVDAMKPEAIFDIGIVLHQLKQKDITCPQGGQDLHQLKQEDINCPQCGQDYSENMVSTEGWVRCSNTKCRTLFHSADTISSNPIALPDSSEGVSRETKFRRVLLQLHRYKFNARNGGWLDRVGGGGAARFTLPVPRSPLPAARRSHSASLVRPFRSPLADPIPPRRPIPEVSRGPGAGGRGLGVSTWTRGRRAGGSEDVRSLDIQIFDIQDLT